MREVQVGIRISCPTGLVVSAGHVTYGSFLAALQVEYSDANGGRLAGTRNGGQNGSTVDQWLFAGAARLIVRHRFATSFETIHESAVSKTAKCVLAHDLPGELADPPDVAQSDQGSGGSVDAAHPATPIGS